jgi:nicotinate-nucleotide adenylyltransferase
MERSDRALGLIVGMDAFLGLTSWHRWDEILDLAHIIVAHRPGWQVPDQGAIGELIGAHQSTSVDDLHRKLHGHIHIHEVTQLEIASTEIRGLVAAGRDPRFLVPDVVRDLIIENSCYK